VLSKLLGGRTREACTNIVIGSALASLCLAFATVPARSQQASFAGQDVLESELETMQDMIQGGVPPANAPVSPVAQSRPVAPTPPPVPTTRYPFGGSKQNH
jgi:hypothetical protein